jgi:lantibiotic modifying enzyme
MRRISSRRSPVVMSSDGAFLDAAASIGHRIASDAVWRDGRCSWIGAVAEPAVPRRAEFRALGPNLYGGTAGVGLFLAQLAATTGEPQARRTAVGALRHAARLASGLPPARRDGFHSGSLGIAWAAVRAAELLGEAELHAAGRAVLTGLTPASAPDRSPDVVMGAAGTVLALLSLAAALDEPVLVETAVATGEGLIGGASVTRHGWSWAIPGRRYPNHLCGLSHGAGGIGWALLELFHATGDERFRRGATGAFAYERSWLDRGSGTWPDLRLGGERRGSPQTIPSPAAGTWCHGEAGIALTRLRALAILGPDPHRQDAELALETTSRHLARALSYEIEDLSLCHGAAGPADVLLCGAATLGDRWHEGVDLAAALGRVALERHAAPQDWPCGTTGGTTPGLFLGLSGIGWLFLRLHDRGVPSPLALWNAG